MDRVFFDTETFLITTNCKAPKIVCCQFLTESSNEGQIFRREDAEPYVKAMLEDEGVEIVGQRIGFDMACVCETWPHLRKLVFDAYEAGRIKDIGIREKLLNLALHGSITTLPSPDPAAKPRKISYSLDAMAYRRLGIEMEGKEKLGTNQPVGWRLRFGELDGLDPLIYPEEARRYALDDVRVLPLLYAEQEMDAKRVPTNAPWAAECLTTCKAFALYLMTCQGVCIDSAERERVEAMLREEISDEKMEPLYACGIYRRPVPSRPHKNNSGKWTQAAPATRDMKVLRSIIVEVCQQNEIEIQLTDGGESGENKQVSTSSDFLQEIDHYDERLTEYSRRMAIEKLLTTEMPRIQADRVHPNFNELVETGRTSSYDPNGQNVDPRAKGCYIPEPGWVIVSVDYSTIELVTFAQKCLDLFGHSKLAELINAGIDPHAYLGAQMAWAFDSQGFCSAIMAAIGTQTAMEAYEAFMQIKKLQPDYYAHWRKFAKPVGLGYPGGLGPKTFVTLAKGTYGVNITVDQARAAREVWLETFPEAVEYFTWIVTKQQYEVDGENRYWYISPVGMLRYNTTYCAAANGAALQTPAAEGGGFAFWDIVRACKDPSRKSILYGCRPWNWVHDEILVNIPEDQWMHERAFEIADRMVKGMRTVIRDVRVKAQPAIMRRWDKAAETVIGADGRIQVWQAEASQS